MKIASIDIGTNAIKSKIFKTTPTSIEFIEGIRSPIRLGTDVFTNGLLTKDKLDLLIKTLRKYQKNFIKNKISMYEIVATSAFRDTQNSEEARRYVENKIEHPIRIISGLEEAKLIRFHPKAQSRSSKVYVDVGGGQQLVSLQQAPSSLSISSDNWSIFSIINIAFRYFYLNLIKCNIYEILLLGNLIKATQVNKKGKV